jgi:hypothetical protein
MKSTRQTIISHPAGTFDRVVNVSRQQQQEEQKELKINQKKRQKERPPMISQGESPA